MPHCCSIHWHKQLCLLLLLVASCVYNPASCSSGHNAAKLSAADPPQPSDQHHSPSNHATYTQVELLLRQLVEECCKRQDTVIQLNSKGHVQVLPTFDPGAPCPLIDIALRAPERGVGMCTDVALYVIHTGARIIPLLAGAELDAYTAKCSNSTARMFLESVYSEWFSPAGSRALHLMQVNSEHMFHEHSLYHAAVDLFLCKTRFCQQLVRKYINHKGYHSDVWYVGHTSSDVLVEPQQQQQQQQQGTQQPPISSSRRHKPEKVSAINSLRRSDSQLQGGKSKGLLSATLQPSTRSNAHQSQQQQQQRFKGPQIHANYSQFIHVKGKSGLKHTGQVLECWAQHPEFPLLTVVGIHHMDEPHTRAVLNAKNVLLLPKPGSEQQQEQQKPELKEQQQQQVEQDEGKEEVMSGQAATAAAAAATKAAKEAAQKAQFKTAAAQAAEKDAARLKAAAQQDPKQQQQAEQAAAHAAALKEKAAEAEAAAQAASEQAAAAEDAAAAAAVASAVGPAAARGTATAANNQPAAMQQSSKATASPRRLAGLRDTHADVVVAPQPGLSAISGLSGLHLMQLQQKAAGMVLASSCSISSRKMAGRGFEQQQEQKQQLQPLLAKPRELHVVKGELLQEQQLSFGVQQQQLQQQLQASAGQDPPLLPVELEHGSSRNSCSRRSLLGKESLLSFEDIRQLQAGAGVHLCPSEREGFGHYLNEARSAGALVVTTDHPPMNELVHKDWGVLISPRRTGSYADIQALGQYANINAFLDPVDICTAVQQVLAMPIEQRAAKGRRARRQYLLGKSVFVHKMRKLQEHIVQWQLRGEVQRENNEAGLSEAMVDVAG